MGAGSAPAGPGDLLTGLDDLRMIRGGLPVPLRRRTFALACGAIPVHAPTSLWPRLSTARSSPARTAGAVGRPLRPHRKRDSRPAGCQETWHAREHTPDAALITKITCPHEGVNRNRTLGGTPADVVWASRLPFRDDHGRLSSDARQAGYFPICDSSPGSHAARISFTTIRHVPEPQIRYLSISRRPRNLSLLMALPISRKIRRPALWRASAYRS